MPYSSTFLDFLEGFFHNRHPISNEVWSTVAIVYQSEWRLVHLGSGSQVECVREKVCVKSVFQTIPFTHIIARARKGFQMLAISQPRLTWTVEFIFLRFEFYGAYAAWQTQFFFWGLAGVWFWLTFEIRKLSSSREQVWPHIMCWTCWRVWRIQFALWYLERFRPVLIHNNSAPDQLGLQRQARHCSL